MTKDLKMTMVKDLMKVHNNTARIFLVPGLHAELAKPTETLTLVVR